MNAAGAAAAVVVAGVLVLSPAARAGAASAGAELLGQLGQLGDKKTPAAVSRAPGAASGRTVVNPVPGGCVSSGYGPRAGGWHYGTDLAAPAGTPIRAVTSGVVVTSVTADPGGYGQYMRVKSTSGTVTEYGHMRVRLRHVGDRVVAGETIARVGSEGSSTGPHLHLRVYPRGVIDGRGVDPRPWLAAHGVKLRTC